MKIEIENRDNIQILYILGNMDTINTPSMEQELEKIIPGLTGQKLVISLKQVKFVSSSGLRVLVKTYKDCELKGIRIILTDVNKAVEQALLLLKLDTFFTIKPALEDAFR